MSSIDDRIVKMKFDNSQFESGVKTSLNSIDQLKKSLNFDSQVKSLNNLQSASKSLNFDSQTKGLNDLQSAAKSIDLASMAEGIDRLSERFSTLGIVGMEAISHLASTVIDPIIDSGVAMAKALSVDQINEGFAKYEENALSIAAILNQSGRDMEDVTSIMDQLAWYSDSTSYNFNSMTSALARFTAQGIELEDSVPMIMGIGNSLSYAGISAKEGSAAFNIYAKAMSKGYMSLKEFQSLELQNFMTKGLKEQFIAAAEELDIIEEGAVTLDNFTDELTKGKWLSRDVMMKVLGGQYGSYTKNLYDFIQQHEEETGEILSASQAIELYTGEMDEFGKKTFLAAQEARTFTEAIDAVKDAASSGWRRIFETVFGNYKEATSLWTELSDRIYDIFLAPVVHLDTLLSKWKKLGGYTIMFGTDDNKTGVLWNLFDAYNKLAETISAAFRDIFPEKTAIDLLSFTVKLKDFTESLILSDEQASKLRMTLGYVFGIFRNLWNTVSGIARNISDFVKKSGLIDFLKLVGSYGLRLISKVTKDIAEFFSKPLVSDETYSKTKKIFEILSDVATILYRALRDLWNTIKNIFSGIGTFIKETGIGEFIWDIVLKLGDLIAKAKEYTLHNGFLVGAFESLKDVLSKLKSPLELLHGLFDKIKGIAEKAFEGVKKLWEKIKEIFSSEDSIFGGTQLDFKKILEVISALFLFQKAYDTTWLLKGFQTLFGGLGEIVKGLADSFGQFYSVLYAYASDFRMDAILKFAGAIGILTLALVVLASMDPEKIEQGLSVIARIALILIGTITLLTKALTANPLQKGLGFIPNAMSVINEAFTAFKFSTIVKQVIKLAAAIAILAGVVFLLGSMDANDLENGVFALVGIIAAFGAFVFAISKTKGLTLRSGLAMLEMAIALGIMALAVKGLGSMSMEDLIKGLAGIGVLLLEIFLFVKMLDDAGGLTAIAILSKSAGGLLVMAIAIDLMTVAVKALGALSIKELAKGLAAVGAMLLGVAGFCRIMAQDGMLTGGKLAAVAAGMVIFAIALNLMMIPVKVLASMPLDSLIIGLAALAALLITIGIVTNIIGKENAGGFVAIAAGMVIFALAMDLMIPAFVALGLLNITQIGTALLAMAGAFLVLGIAGAVLGPIAPTLLLVSAAMFLFGLALATISLGVGVMAIALSAGATGIVLAIETILVSIIEFRAKITLAIATLIQSFCEAVEIGIPAILHMVGSVLVSVLVTIGEYAPTILITVVAIIASLVEALGDALPSLIQAFIDLVIAVVEGIAWAIVNNTDRIIAAMHHVGLSVWYFLITMVQELLSRIPGVGSWIAGKLDVVKDDIKERMNAEDASKQGNAVGAGLMTGTADGIKENEAAVTEEASNASGGIWSAFTEKLSGENGFSIGNLFGSNISEGLSNGIKDNSYLAEMSAFDLGIDTEQAAALALDTHSPSKKFEALGEYSAEGLALGIEGKTPTVKEKVAAMAQKALDALSEKSSSFDNIGEQSANGFAEGLGKSSVLSKVASKARELANKAYTSACNALEIHSPSRKFAEIGMYSDYGFAEGINKYSRVVESASEDLSNDTLSVLENEMERISGIIDGSINTDPTIRPVLDLSSIQNGSDQINSIMSGTTLAASIGYKGQQSSFYDLISEIGNLRSDLAAMQEANALDPGLLSDVIREGLSGLGVFMDGGKVGKMVTRYQSNARRAAGV